MKRMITNNVDSFPTALAALAEARGYATRAMNYKLNGSEKQECKEILESRPTTLILPTGSKCNMKCIFCTDRTGTTRYHYKNLSFNEFLRFAEPLQCAKSVGLYGWGEPLVSPHYTRIFDYVTKEHYSIEVHVVTNGVLMGEKWIHKLVNYEWSNVTVSINAAGRLTYQRLMGMDMFQEVVRNVRHLVQIRTASGKRSPILTLSFVTLTQNIEELPAFVDIAADLGSDAILIQDFKILEKGQEKYSLFNLHSLANECYLRAKERSEKRGIPLMALQPIIYSDRSLPEACFDPWDSFRVAENGNVYTCCYSSQVMGNVLEQKLDEIWNGNNYRYYRRTVNTENPPPECRCCVKKVLSEQLISHKWNRI
jgi:radical SAM protein with 4Fe4S-binding SPASM domain